MTRSCLLAVPLALALAMFASSASDAGVEAGPGTASKPSERSEVDPVSLAALGPRPRPRPSTRGGAEQRCTEDGAYCITRDDYVADVCETIEAVARDNALDPNFFVRLIWRESLFDATAISPAGAEGIAQFMPGTARLRGLEDAFNPAEALRASAEYLSELARDFGNLGLAAVAYNGGEHRAERFVARESGLPLETRAYVYAITGHSAVTWRDEPPAVLDLSPEGDAGFQNACIARAGNRGFREFREPLLPWGVIITSNISREGAERHVVRLRNRYGPVLMGETVAYSFGRTPGMRRSLHLAQIGRTSRAEADALCDRLRAAGGACIVLSN